MNYYCVTAVFKNGKAKAGVISEQAKKKPKNLFLEGYAETVFKLWFISEERADELVKMIKNGEVYIDELITFYEDSLLLEEKEA
jgi:hypothetical protein